MRRLLPYAVVIYDTNCVLLYCFHYELPVRSGPPIPIQEDDVLSPLTRSLTENLTVAGKRITTLLIAIEEIDDPLLASVVARRISEDEVRTRIGLRRGERFPAPIQLAIVNKCRKRFRNLKMQPWFTIESRHPEDVLIQEARAFFRAVERDPALRARLRADKGVMPSDVDLQLMAYSKEGGAPIVTRDSHFTAFSNELRDRGVVTEVVALDTIHPTTV